MKRLGGLAIALISVSQAVAADPWPMERQDRWGTARATAGPALSEYVLPWKKTILRLGSPVSHGAAILESGIGYFGDWIDGSLIRFDVPSASPLGSFLALNFVQCTPAVGANGLIYFHAQRRWNPNPVGRVFAINPATMDFDWVFDTNSDKVSDYDASSPTLGPEGDVAIGSTNGTAWRLDRTTGTPVWTRTGLSGNYRTIVFTRDDSKVIVANGSSITALNWADGSIAWTRSLGGEAGAPGVAPSGTIVVGSAANRIFGVDPNTGVVLWERTTLSVVRPAPAFDDAGNAYVGCDDFRLYSVRVSDGFRNWSFTGNHEFRTPPIVDANNRIYIGARTGTRYCINNSGGLVWQVGVPASDIRGGSTIDSDGTLYCGFTGSPAGLFVISQLPANVLPESFEITSGTHNGGTLDSFGLSDDDRFRVLSGSRRSAGVAVQATLPSSNLHRMRVVLEPLTTVPGIRQDVMIWNWGSQKWFPLDSRLSSSTDTEFTIAVEDTSRFVDGNKQVRVQVLWSKKELAPGTWEGELDQLRFLAEPVWTHLP